MKRGVFVSGCILLASTLVFAAGSKSDAAWVGVWHGELDGQPSVLLTLADDGGSLGGTFVLDIVSRDDRPARVIAAEPHVLLNPRVDGSTLSFEAMRLDRSQEPMTFTVTLGGNGKAEIHCVNCKNAPVVELQKEQYR
ncbi:MAG: hypothetical protein WB608_12695 [Terracidiphilus sp.]